LRMREEERGRRKREKEEVIGLVVDKGEGLLFVEGNAAHDGARNNGGIADKVGELGEDNRTACHE